MCVHFGFGFVWVFLSCEQCSVLIAKQTFREQFALELLMLSGIQISISNSISYLMRFWAIFSAALYARLGMWSTYFKFMLPFCPS